MHLGDISFDKVEISMEEEKIEELNHGQRSNFREDSGSQSMKSFSEIKVHGKLPVELRKQGFNTLSFAPFYSREFGWI